MPTARFGATGCVSIVVITHNRCESVVRTLRQLCALPEAPPVVVVDNASTDGTSETVRRAFPDVDVIRLQDNVGAAARTVGVRRVSTPYVAFSDDDSWWEPDALETACAVLERSPQLGVLAARVLVGEEGRLDPVCLQMRSSPLGHVPLAGPRILGFVACGSVVRRAAYLEVGGFHPRYGVGGEESLLAIDLAERGWQCAYVDEVVARHDPSPQRDPRARLARVHRNDLWTVWLRRRPPAALTGTVRALVRCATDSAARDGTQQAVAGWRWVLQERTPVGRRTEHLLRLLSRKA